jgi:hypothetical protein
LAADVAARHAFRVSPPPIAMGGPAVSDGARARRSTIADAIRRYLARHPSAADSDLGISEWWLPEVGVEGAVAEVRDALEVLEREGVVEACVLDDGRCVWRAATDRRA